MLNATKINAEFNLKDGFAWVTFDADGNHYSLQACLMELDACKDDEKRRSIVAKDGNLFKKQINKNDDGMDWGLSVDANKKAFDAFGSEECMKFFAREVKKIGVRFV